MEADAESVPPPLEYLHEHTDSECRVSVCKKAQEEREIPVHRRGSGGGELLTVYRGLTTAHQTLAGQHRPSNHVLLPARLRAAQVC